MNKTIVIEQIKKLCINNNDRKINIKICNGEKIFHAKYVFLGNDLYVTDGFDVMKINELDIEILNKILETNDFSKIKQYSK